MSASFVLDERFELAEPFPETEIGTQEVPSSLDDEGEMTLDGASVNRRVAILVAANDHHVGGDEELQAGVEQRAASGPHNDVSIWTPELGDLGGLLMAKSKKSLARVCVGHIAIARACAARGRRSFSNLRT